MAKKSSDWRVSEYSRHINVAVSDKPFGFTNYKNDYEGILFLLTNNSVDGRLTTDWAIDGHVFLDPETGYDYMFYSHLYSAKGAGITYDRLISPVKVANTPVTVTQGSEAWEDKTGDPNDGSVRALSSLTS